MRVLVTGSAGYLGPVIVRELRGAHQVLGYDTEWFGRDVESTWSVRGDIRDPLVHPDWPDVVVHLAGLSNDPMGALDPDLTSDINYIGTFRMLSRYARARHVVVSSCAVYGQCEGLATEWALPNPQTAYASCKVAVDGLAAARKTFAPEGLNYISLRLGTVYGWSPNHRLDTVVNRMVFDALNGRGVTVQGAAARPLVHINDVASAVRWAVEGSACGVFNVVGENVHIAELGYAISRFASVPMRTLNAVEDTRDYMASGEKLLRAGWGPTYSVEGSLPVLFEKTMSIKSSDLDKHIRLDQLRRLIDAGELDPQTLRYAA